MNKKFYVINKKAVALCFIFLVVNGGISGVAIGRILAGGTKLWLIPTVIFFTFFLISALVMPHIITAGIEVKNSIVNIPDLNIQNGRLPKFHLNELNSIELHDKNGNIIDPDVDSLIGARIIFNLNDDRTEEYYPASITKKQYKSIESGMMSLLNELKSNDFFDE